MQDPKTPGTEEPKAQPFWDDEEDTDRDLKEFALFAKLEDNGGKPTRGFYIGGCFFILPVLAFLSIALFFLMNHLY